MKTNFHTILFQIVYQSTPSYLYFLLTDEQMLCPFQQNVEYMFLVLYQNQVDLSTLVKFSENEFPHDTFPNSVSK